MKSNVPIPIEKHGHPLLQLGVLIVAPLEDEQLYVIRLNMYCTSRFCSFNFVTVCVVSFDS